jgi:hypothetical protein
MKKLHTMGTQEFTYTPRSTTSDSLTLSRVHVVAVSDFWHTSGTQPRATHDFPHMTSGLLVRTKPLVRRRKSSGVADEEWKLLTSGS